MTDDRKETPQRPSQEKDSPDRKEKPNKTFGNEPPIKEPLRPKHPDQYEVIGKKESGKKP